MKKAILLFVAIILLGNLNSKATHVVGGDISVQWVTGNTFHIKVSWYRDWTSVINFDPSVTVGIYDLITNANVSCSALPFIGSNYLTLGDSCYSPQRNGLGVEYGHYEADVVIPDNPNGYYLTFNKCCRNNTISNINNPGLAGATWYAEIPNPALHNSTPTFIKAPRSYFCLNNQNLDSLGCTDLDGDSLVYSLITPLGSHGLSSSVPCPDPGSYPNINWKSPYSASNMVGGTTPMAINPSTGVITANPPNQGLFVFCVRVEQYRRSDGKKMGEIRRDMQYLVRPCTATIPTFTSGGSNPLQHTYTIKAGETFSALVSVADDEPADLLTLSATSVLFTNGSNTTFPGSPSGHSNVQSLFTFASSCSDTGTHRVTFVLLQQGCTTNTLSFDVDITVEAPSVPAISALPAFTIDTVAVGDTLTFVVSASLGNGTERIFLTAQSELLANGSASFPDTAGYTLVEQVFTFMPTCADARDTPYRVTFNSGECSKSSYTVDVLVTPPQLDPVPNIFTPNEDKKNDFFQFKYHVASSGCEFNIKIFDKWGLLMYESSDMNFKWDGTNKGGTKVAEGVYYYMIEASIGATPYKRRGTINVKL